jgi:UDP-N-acetyl-2-amino-2-deoxyglucuronate dehydrogenase
MRVGLIGAGNISTTHARALEQLPAARLVAVFGPTLERAARLASTHGATAYDQLDRLLDRESLDIVIVGTPSGLHAEHGAAAARRGIHVLVEKPLAITTGGADALIEEARRAGVTLGVIFQDRLKAAIHDLKTIVERGALGRLLLARAQVPWFRPPEYYRESRWRGTWALDGGGALINQAIHTIDLLLWIGGPVTRVFGRTATRCHDIEVEDTAAAVVEFASGALGTIEATTCASPGRPRRLEIAGAEGTAILDGDQLATGAGSRRIDSIPENAASPVVSDVLPHREIIADFIAACRDRRPPCCDGREGRRSLAVVEAVYQSARTGGPVELPEALR